MTQEAKNKIAENLNHNLPKLNGVTIRITLKINSENEDEKAIYFLNKFSSQLQNKFGFYNISSTNRNKIAVFEMFSDKEYSFPDLKRFVTEMGYKLIEVEDYLTVKK